MLGDLIKNMIGPIIGPLIDLFNRYGDGLGYSVMLAICAASLIAGSLLVIKIRTPRLA